MLRRPRLGRRTHPTRPDQRQLTAGERVDRVDGRRSPRRVGPGGEPMAAPSSGAPAASQRSSTGVQSLVVETIL
jgi:hypothetical protein